jgi:hypothetical protein
VQAVEISHWGERNQSFKFGRHLVAVVSLYKHQKAKFPGYLIVIHVALFHESVARNEKDEAITPQMLRRINWTIVLATPWSRAPWIKVRTSLCS